MKRGRTYTQPRQPKTKRQQTAVRKDRSDYTLARAPKPEFKWWGYTLGSSSATTTATVVDLSTVLSRGTLPVNNFIGRQLDLRGIDFRWIISGSQSNVMAGADLTNITRIILFQWMNAGTPAGTDVIGAASGSLCYQPVSYTNYDNIEVLADIMETTHMTVYNSNSTYSSSNIHCGRRYIKAKKLRPVEFNVGSTAIIKGGVYVCYLSDSAATPNPQVQFNASITFVD